MKDEMNDMKIIDGLVIAESIEHYGKNLQLAVCQEECAELIQAISKDIRGQRTARDHIAEELGDVLICCEMLQQIYQISDTEVGEWISFKQDRMRARLEEQK